MNVIDRNILRRMIEKHGVEAQVSMIIEECSELILAISHYKRGRVEIEDIVGEIVDVTIMLEQARIIYDPDDNIFGKIHKKKIKRIEDILRK